MKVVAQFWVVLIWVIDVVVERESLDHVLRDVFTEFFGLLVDVAT
jgi:hypothetical protein